MPPDFLLASRSPRRRALLEQLGLAFEVRPADVAERPAPGQDPGEYALAMARAKARVVVEFAGRGVPILGADTDVVIDGEILGKPRDREDGVAMLRRLGGRVHEVFSAVCVHVEEQASTALSVTRVRFGAVTGDAAEAYWDSGEPADKAGGYALQGRGAMFVKSVDGSCSGVIGLPLFETCALLRAAGVAVPGTGRA